MNDLNFEIFNKVCLKRRSVRGFLDVPVDNEILHKVFHAAQQAPSSCNTQPWKVHLVSGQRCKQLRERFVEVMNAGEYKPDFSHSMQYQGIYRDRQYDAAVKLYGAMGIVRDDKAARHQAFLRNYYFFNAPHVAFIGMEEGFGLREAVDIGMYAQTLMLALTAQGLASCPQNSLSFHGELLRKELNIESNWRVLFGISFGYEDTAEAANKARIERADLEESVKFYE